MRPGIFEEKSNNHLKEVTVKIRERYRASTYAQLEETASGDSNRVKEKRFLSFIALGNAVLADEFLARAYNKQESFRFGVMSTSSIQQARYATVASVTLFCRTAIDNGLPENLAYSISDSYLLHLDETESIEEIQFLSLSAFREYCQVMQDWRLQSCRKEIKQCCEYILMHIHEPISLTELAELVNLSPNHLSALFLKETSFRPTEYIRAQKLNYARYILDNYSPTIATLANLLAFPSPSAFARQFKQHFNAGMIGINVGVPAPMAWFPFTGWNRSFFGDLHIQGTESIQFYTRQKVTLTRWPKADDSHLDPVWRQNRT